MLAWPIDNGAVMHPLRGADARLQRAPAALPGFQIVSFDQACCAILRHRFRDDPINAEGGSNQMYVCRPSGLHYVQSKSAL
jgi:hypothetical protein